MRPLWYIAALFVLLGIGNACRTPEQAVPDGCNRLASGLIHCQNPNTDSR
jgi:hypothetical protein